MCYINKVLLTYLLTYLCKIADCVPHERVALSICVCGRVIGKVGVPPKKVVGYGKVRLIGMGFDKILTIPIPYQFLLIDSIPYRFDSLSILIGQGGGGESTNGFIYINFLLYNFV